MPSAPRSPKSVVKVRRLPKVGDTVMVPAKVTRLSADGQITVELRNGHKATARPEYLFADER